MFKFDLGSEESATNGLLQEVCGVIEQWGLAAVLEAISEPRECLARDEMDASDGRGWRLVDLAQRLGSGSSCNVLPADMPGGVCHRLLVALSIGSRGKNGSVPILDQVIRHLAACGVSVDGDRPTLEPTRHAIVFHDELNTKAFTERHRPILEGFRSRGVRIVMLHVDSTNRITWVERDLADPALVTH